MTDSRMHGEILRTRAAEPMDRIKHDPKSHNPCPPLTAGEREELKKSLEEGYLAGWPVVRSAGPACEGEIIDGFHRTEICAELGIEPIVHLMPVETETRFKIYQIRANLQRRNMTTGQRGILAVELASLYEAEARANQGRRTDLIDLPPLAEECSKTDALAKETLAKAAKDAGLGRTAAYEAQALVEAAKTSSEAADLLADVKSGDLALKTAYKKLRPRADQDAIDTSISNEAQAEAEIAETVALMQPEVSEELYDTVQQRAVGDAVRLAIELDKHIRDFNLMDQDVLEYKSRPHTFGGTARRLADWFDLTAEVLELNRRSK